MSVAKAQASAYKRLGTGSQPRPPPFTHPSSQYCDIRADFAKVDSILRHLQQTESHAWLGEITHCCTQVCYLLLQNYNISRFNFYNYNCHLIMLTAFFFAQRIWFALWRATQFSDAHGLRFACHIVLFLVLLNSLYCSMQLVLKDSLAGGFYLATPLLCSALFYRVYLRAHTNVFTAELFGMLGRCAYHSLETAYCVGVLPLKFLQYEHVYFDTARCLALTALVAVHAFLSLLCLELHSLGSEVLQQTRMLGEWRWIADPARLKSISPKPAEWSPLSCPYPRGAVVRCKGRYYEAVAALNTCSPASPPHRIYPIAYVLGDSQRTKALVLSALFLLNLTLVLLVLRSSQWSMYAVMLVPNCGHFLYVKYRRSHAFFNPAHLNIRQLQQDLNIEIPQYKLDGEGRSCGAACGNHLGGGWSSYGSGMTEDCDHRPGDVPGDRVNGGSHHSNGLATDPGVAACLQCPNPLFMSAVSASTMFFFGPAGAARSPSDLAPSGLLRGEGDM